MHSLDETIENILHDANYEDFSKYKFSNNYEINDIDGIYILSFESCDDILEFESCCKVPNEDELVPAKSRKEKIRNFKNRNGAIQKTISEISTAADNNSEAKTPQSMDTVASGSVTGSSQNLAIESENVQNSSSCDSKIKIEPGIEFSEEFLEISAMDSNSDQSKSQAFHSDHNLSSSQPIAKSLSNNDLTPPIARSKCSELSYEQIMDPNYNPFMQFALPKSEKSNFKQATFNSPPISSSSSSNHSLLSDKFDLNKVHSKINGLNNIPSSNSSSSISCIIPAPNPLQQLVNVSRLDTQSNVDNKHLYSIPASNHIRKSQTISSLPSVIPFSLNESTDIFNQKQTIQQLANGLGKLTEPELQVVIKAWIEYLTNLYEETKKGSHQAKVDFEQRIVQWHMICTALPIADEHKSRLFAYSHSLLADTQNPKLSTLNCSSSTSGADAANIKRLTVIQDNIARHPVHFSQNNLKSSNPAVVREYDHSVLRQIASASPRKSEQTGKWCNMHVIIARTIQSEGRKNYLNQIAASMPTSINGSSETSNIVTNSNSRLQNNIRNSSRSSVKLPSSSCGPGLDILNNINNHNINEVNFSNNQNAVSGNGTANGSDVNYLAQQLLNAANPNLIGQLMALILSGTNSSGPPNETQLQQIFNAMILESVQTRSSAPQPPEALGPLLVHQYLSELMSQLGGASARIQHPPQLPPPPPPQQSLPQPFLNSQTLNILQNIPFQLNNVPNQFNKSLYSTLNTPPVNSGAIGASGSLSKRPRIDSKHFSSDRFPPIPLCSTPVNEPPLSMLHNPSFSHKSTLRNPMLTPASYPVINNSSLAPLLSSLGSAGLCLPFNNFGLQNGACLPPHSAASFNPNNFNIINNHCNIPTIPPNTNIINHPPISFNNSQLPLISCDLTNPQHFFNK